MRTSRLSQVLEKLGVVARLDLSVDLQLRISTKYESPRRRELSMLAFGLLTVPRNMIIPGDLLLPSSSPLSKLSTGQSLPPL